MCLGCQRVGGMRGSGRISAQFQIAPILGAWALLASVSQADTFTIRLDDDRLVKVNARLAGSGQDSHALEFSDGQLQVVPADRVVEQEKGPDPTPVTTEEMVSLLETEFGRERMVVYVDKPYIVVLVRASTAAAEPVVLKSMQGVVKKGGQFFKGMQASFLQFAKQLRVDVSPIRFPLVALIFESDGQFDAYTAVVTGQQGLMPANIAAFYDLLSNRLVIRLRECSSFDTPLHEAVHQQAYNRGVFQRLAPVPAWLNEGMATGFEGTGEKSRGNPRQVNDRYARLAAGAQQVDWGEIIANDRAFQGDGLAAEAYGQAWGLHWFLVTQYKTEYNQLVRHFAKKTPLSLDRPDERLAEFEQIVGKSVEELHEQFTRELIRIRVRQGRTVP